MKWTVTIEGWNGFRNEMEVEAESIKKAIAAMEYSSKKLKMEIVGVRKWEEKEKDTLSEE